MRQQQQFLSLYLTTYRTCDSPGLPILLHSQLSTGNQFAIGTLTDSFHKNLALIFLADVMYCLILAAGELIDSCIRLTFLLGARNRPKPCGFNPAPLCEDCLAPRSIGKSANIIINVS